MDGQNLPIGSYYPLNTESPHKYYEDGSDAGALRIHNAYMMNQGPVSASCDDRNLLRDQRRQQTSENRQSRTATAAPYQSQRKDGSIVGPAVLENAFIQQKL